MSRWPFLSAVVVSAVLSGCAADDPYLFTDYRYHQRGSVVICYNEDTTTLEQVTQMAEEVCRPFDRTAKLQLNQPYQCSWTAPTQAIFFCTPRPGETPPPIQPHLAPMRHDNPLPAE
ncbi:MAG: hypothetical protein F8N37_12305 [Telmatospirillum sp.]|nr:hypothetical protein [Telmatospirillum sp.]